MERVMNMFGLGEIEDDEEYLAPPKETLDPPMERSKSSNVISLHTAGHYRVVVAEPSTFDESQGIVDHLKAKRQVVLNLETIDKETAKRIVDFVSGACYALDGRAQKVSQGVILFAPFNVDITNELRSVNNERGALPWLFSGKNRRT